MVDTAYVTTSVVLMHLIGIMSYYAISRAQMNELENEPATQIDVLAQHAMEPRHGQKSELQFRRRLAEATRQLSNTDKVSFDIKSYVRRLKSFNHPAGVNLNNNNSFVLFGNPVDYVLSRTDENLMVAGKELFIQGRLKVSGPLTLSYYTRTVLQATRQACDASDPNADVIACSLLSYPKVTTLKGELDDLVTEFQNFKTEQAKLLKLASSKITTLEGELDNFKTEQAKKLKLAEDDCRAYTDLLVKEARASAKKYTDDTKTALEKFATQKGEAAQTYADGVGSRTLSSAKADAKKYTDDTKTALEKFATQKGEAAQTYADGVGSRTLSSAKADAKKYTDAVDQRVTAVNGELTRTSNSLSAKVTECQTQSKAYTDQREQATKGFALDTAFPIGSLFLTYDSKEPEQLFPGTKWDRVAGGRTLVGVVPPLDTTDYGSYDFKQAQLSFPEKWSSTFEHTLSVDQMPTHQHDNVWRWACDQTLVSGNSREKCLPHSGKSRRSVVRSSYVTRPYNVPLLTANADLCSHQKTSRSATSTTRRSPA